MMRAVVQDCWPWWVAIAGCALLAWRIRIPGSTRAPRVPIRQLLADERGAVQSLSFVLTLPVFVLLMLFIVQLSQLTIARIVVEYAAYAAARSAMVWIPADLGDHESANRLGLTRQYLGPMRDETDLEYDRYWIGVPSRKLRKIEQAAAQALLPICPSRHVGAGENHPGMQAISALEQGYRAWDPDSVNNGRIPSRLRNKLAYALAATEVELEVRHQDTEPPLQWHDIRPYREEFEPNEIGWQDQIVVTVRHDFALLPGPARFLAKRVIAPGQSSDPVSNRIVAHNTVYAYPLSATVRLGNEGEKSVLPYVQPVFWQ